GVAQDGNEGGLGQRRTKQYPLRVHREKDIHCGNVAVARILLGEVEWLLVCISGQTAGGGALAVGKGTRLSVFLAADLRGVGQELLVEFSAALGEFRVI